MNNDVLDFHIHIQEFSRLLVWLMLICFLGMCITGWLMLVVSRFFLTKTGSLFSIIDFELPYSFSKFKGIVDNITDKTKDTVRMNLKLDNYFMPFAYLLLFFGGWYVLQRQHFDIQECSYYKILWLPFIAWLFDILENQMAFACLETLTKTKAMFLFAFSLIKWLLIAGYVVFIMAMYMI